LGGETKLRLASNGERQQKAPSALPIRLDAGGYGLAKRGLQRFAVGGTLVISALGRPSCI